LIPLLIPFCVADGRDHPEREKLHGRDDGEVDQRLRAGLQARTGDLAGDGPARYVHAGQEQPEGDPPHGKSIEEVSA
jgi:hypothetical protein